jgi:hypothetical protein
MKDTDKEGDDSGGFAEQVRQIERDILNTYTVKRDTGLADGAGAPGSTAAGDNRAGLPEADADRGQRK